jgi:hypothetical protein
MSLKNGRVVWMVREVLTESIRISKSLKKFLDKSKLINNESYSSVIFRLCYKTNEVEV